MIKKVYRVIPTKLPKAYTSKVNDSTNVNALSRSFDFLLKEPELYSLADVKRKIEYKTFIGLTK